MAEEQYVFLSEDAEEILEELVGDLQGEPEATVDTFEKAHGIELAAAHREFLLKVGQSIGALPGFGSARLSEIPRNNQVLIELRQRYPDAFEDIENPIAVLSYERDGVVFYDGDYDWEDGDPALVAFTIENCEDGCMPAGNFSEFIFANLSQFADAQ